MDKLCATCKKQPRRAGYGPYCSSPCKSNPNCQSTSARQCQNPECTNPLVPGQRKYCCRRCCSRSGWLKWRKTNPKRSAEISRSQRAKLHKKYNDHKKASVCAVCGAAPPVDIHYHHVKPKDKVITISLAIGEGYSWTRIQKEMEKTIPVCKGCHFLIEAFIQRNFTQEEVEKAEQIASKAN